MLVKSQIKYIQSLGQKKFRDSEGLFVAEGPKIVHELLLAHNVKPRHIYATGPWQEQNPGFAASYPASALTVVTPGELNRISFLTTPNQVLALFERPVFNPGGLEDTISLVLDGIQDPGNLGTIIRIADWFGLAHIICSHETADAFNIKTIQSSMGSISRVEVRYEELGAFLDSHKHLPAYAATLSGTSIYEMDRISCGLILIGNESRGISEELLRRVSHHITIPGAGHAESLNAAVASGIILSHLVQG